MLQVTLYTRPGCGLCERALETLAGLSAQVPHRVRQVNIDADAALFEALWDKIPVVEVGALRLAAPLEREGLLALLRDAQSQLGQRRERHG